MATIDLFVNEESQKPFSPILEWMKYQVKQIPGVQLSSYNPLLDHMTGQFSDLAKKYQGMNFAIHWLTPTQYELTMEFTPNAIDNGLAASQIDSGSNLRTNSFLDSNPLSKGHSRDFSTNSIAAITAGYDNNRNVLGVRMRLPGVDSSTSYVLEQAIEYFASVLEQYGLVPANIR